MRWVQFAASVSGTLALLALMYLPQSRRNFVFRMVGWAALFILLAIGALFAAHGVLWLAGPH